MEAFEHVLGRYSKQTADERLLTACLVAWGTNMGLGRMGDISDIGYHTLVATSENFLRLETLKLTFRTLSEGDPRIFPWAFFARTAPPTSGMLASPERRYTKRLHPGRVVWVSCFRPSQRTMSDICPL